MPIISIIIGIIPFVIGWIYAIREFGFFLGVGLGWIPALFIAFFIATLVKWILAAIVIAFALKPLREVTFADWSRRREGAVTAPPQTPRDIIKQRAKVAPKIGSREYLDWANREGAWCMDEDDAPMPPRNSPEYLDWANREGRWARSDA